MAYHNEIVTFVTHRKGFFRAPTSIIAYRNTRQKRLTAIAIAI